MNRCTTVLTLAVGAVTTVGASACLLPSATANAVHSKAHHYHFTDKTAGKAIDKGPLLIQADDEYQGKKLTGTDEINCTFGKTRAHCHVAIDIKGGLLYGHFSETPHDVLSGKITGGAGTFHGAHGTISGNSSASISVTYKY